jgi:hypothetical protein
MNPTVSLLSFAVASSCVSQGISGVQTNFLDPLIAIIFLAECGKYCSEVSLWLSLSGSHFRVVHHKPCLLPGSNQDFKEILKRLRKFLGYQTGLIKITFL